MNFNLKITCLCLPSANRPNNSNLKTIVRRSLATQRGISLHRRKSPNAITGKVRIQYGTG